MREPRSRPRPGSPGPVPTEPASVEEQASAPRLGLDRLADRWSAVLLTGLQEGAKRYAELRTAAPGISEKMLTQTLRSLERDGLVTRKDYGTVPPEVEYYLTELGRSLISPLQQMCTWTDAHAAEVQQARTRYDLGSNPIV